MVGHRMGVRAEGDEALEQLVRLKVGRERLQWRAMILHVLLLRGMTPGGDRGPLLARASFVRSSVHNAKPVE